MKAQRVDAPVTGAESWTVVDADYFPVDPAERYLAYLTATERSPHTVRAYAHAALCHDLRGERDEADRYIELTHRYYLSRRDRGTRGAQQAPPLALALARRGRFDEALDLIPLVLREWSTGVTLEALCEIAALRERWDDAVGLVAAARGEAEFAEDPSLRSFADRLDGRAAGVRGDVANAANLLARSADGFAELEIGRAHV